jgi:hypothetical protein
MRRLHLIALLLILSGCGTVRGPAPPGAVVAPPSAKEETVEQGAARRAQAAKPTYNLSGYPPAVRDGYIDGCESAKGTSLGRKNAARMSSDAQYAMGWNDGYSICQKK